jgi:threonine aldolase
LKIIDLRSDTVTLPPEPMRQAMQDAPLGDDVYGEDPTINKLQDRLAQLTGKDSALFVASGTMGNLVSVLSHCGRGDEAILGDRAHIAIWEQSAASCFGGVSLRTVANQMDGTLPIKDIEAAINEPDVHRTNSKLICLENTWNGQPLSTDYMREVKELALQNGLAVHLDGARLFNAAVYHGLEIADFCKWTDSVQLCFSKGLSAPVGSIVCGSHEFIARAKRHRKALGGGMRQAGVLAAACLYAIDNMVERLKEDHDNAALLAEGLGKISGIKVTMPTKTNMVFFEGADGKRKDLVSRMKDSGILVGIEKQRGIRAVTHYGIERKDIEDVVARIAALV